LYQTSAVAVDAIWHMFCFAVMLDAEKEKISEEIIDAMLEPDETAAAEGSSDKQSTTEKPTDETPTESVDEKSAENTAVADSTNTSAEKMPTETEAVPKETDSAADDSDVAKQQSSTATEDGVTMATAQVDEKGDTGKDVEEQTDESEQPDTAAETGAGGAKLATGG